MMPRLSLAWSEIAWTTVRRMLLAWKNAHRFEASTFLLMDSVWAPLPSVSDNARQSAITAINSAIFLFSLEASLACSACSMLSCALMILSLLDRPTIDRTPRPAQEESRYDETASKCLCGLRRGDAPFDRLRADGRCRCRCR